MRYLQKPAASDFSCYIRPKQAKAANDAIAAAQSIKKAWTDPNSLTNGRGALMKTAASDKGIAPHQTPHLYPHLPADIGSQERVEQF